MLRIHRIPDFTPKLLLVRKRLLGLEPEGIKYALPHGSVHLSSVFDFADAAFNSSFPLLALTTWLCWREWSCWRSSAKSWQPSPSSNTTQLPPPRRNLSCCSSICLSQADRSGKNWAFGVWWYRWHRVGKILPVAAHPCRTDKAHTDRIRLSPSSGLLGFTRKGLWSCFWAGQSRGTAQPSEEKEEEDRGQGADVHWTLFQPLHFLSLLSSSVFLSYQPKDGNPLIVSRRNDVCVFISCPIITICSHHCLSVESHLSVTEKCFLSKHFYLNPPYVLSVRRQEAVEKNHPLPSQRLYVPVVT